jgi:hypothetical protein
VKKFLKSALKKLFAVVAGLFLAVIILATTAAVALNIKPFDITPYLPYMQEYLKVDENRITIRRAVLSYKGSLRIALDDITLITPERAVISRAKHLNMAFSNRSLVLGNIVIKHAFITGLDLQLEVNDSGVDVATIEVKKEKKEPLDIVRLLNEQKIRALKYLKTLEIEDSTAQITDLLNGDLWLLKKTNGKLEKSDSRGTQVELYSHVQRYGEDLSMPVLFEFNHLPQSEYADIAVSVDNVDSHLLAKYIPESIKNVLSGEGTVKTGAKLVQGKGVVAPYFQVDLVKGALAIDKIYEFPLAFDTLHIQGDYTQIGSHELTIRELRMKDDSGYVLTGRGAISHIQEDPYLDLVLMSESMPLRHLLRYLPNQKIGHVTKWISHNVHQAIGKNIRLAYTGAVSEFPCKEVDCGFNGSFDFNNLTLRFMDEVAPARELAGHFIIRDGGIVIKSDSGKINNQEVSNVVVHINDLFDREKEKVVTVIGKASGSIQGVLERIGEKVGEGWFGGKVQGEHVSDIKVAVPLKSKLTFEDVDFTVDATLKNVVYNVPVGKHKLNFKSDSAAISIMDKKLKFTGEGHLEEVPLHATWQENLSKPGIETNVSVKGAISDERLNTLVRNFLPIESIGYTPFRLDLSKIEPDVYDYELKSSFDQNKLIVPLLNWEKVDNSDIDLVARGRADVNGTMFALDNLAISGEGIEIAGSMYLDRKGNLSLSLSPFKLGETDINANMKDDKIQFTGTYLDISGLDLLQSREAKNGDASEEKSHTDIAFEADIAAVKMPGGVLAPVTVSAQRQHNKWQKFIFSGISGSGASVEINLDVGEGGRRVLKAKATNAGEALKTLGLYQNIHEGNLTLINYLDEGEQGNKSRGELKITRTRIKDFPILAKLLSLLSLEQLLNPGKGIIFDDVVFPFTAVDDTISIHKAILEGPSIGMRFSGDIHTANTGNKLDIEGSLIPVQGLNKIVSNIPIVGDVLTGSQDGLMVADFKIRGKYHDPDITVNPLSVVTPGLLKDVFGVITGKKKKE